MKRKYISIRAYADQYDVDPRTVKKWADAGLVELIRIALKGQRPILRVQDCPPGENTRQYVDDPKP